MKIMNYKLILSLLAFSVLYSCTKEEVPYFSGKDSANFWIHTQNLSLYGKTPAELPQDTIVMDIALSGRRADYDRFTTAVAVEDTAGTPEESKKTTAAPGTYIILGGTIPANELNGKFKVVLKNTSALDNDASVKLRIKMVETEDFVIGLRENNYIDIVWSRAILQPPTWRAMRFFFCAVYSTTVYKIFMEVTGLKEFYYYEGQISQEEGFVMGKKFGDRVRELSAQQGSPLLHEDGLNAGLPIIPIY